MAAALALPAGASSVKAAPATACTAVYLANPETNTVVYQKNAEKRMYPASLTKLMTAILVMEKYGNNLQQSVTVTAADIEAVGDEHKVLKQGETLTVGQLLDCMLIISANESAETLARVTGGTVDRFIQMMNEKAKALGATGTHYVNPHGLHDPNHYTTARDVYIIAKYAMQFKQIRAIVSTRTLDISTNKHTKLKLTNTNSLLNPGSGYYYSYCQGIKTGTTSEAGACLVSLSANSSDSLYCVAMGGPQHTTAVNSAFADTKKLYQWAFSNYTKMALLDTKVMLAQVPLELAWGKDSLLLYPDSTCYVMVPKNTDTSKVKVVPHLYAPTAYAPIRQGERFGTADVYLGSQKMGTVRLVSQDVVARSAPLYFVYFVGRFFTSVWFIVISAALIAGFLAFLALSSFIRRRKRRERRMEVEKKYRIRK